MRKFTDFVEELAEDEVFVFGSNLSGFHGAGSAGFAMRGQAKNNWREDTQFCDIVKGRTQDKRGHWAVFGVGRGYQVGREGRSYAVATVERPGAQGRVDLRCLFRQLRDLCEFARAHPELTFLVVKLGATREEGGYSYFGIRRVRALWWKLHQLYGIPDNIILPETQEVREQNAANNKEEINFYTHRGEHGFLSNFYFAKQTVDGRSYKSNEHYYQSEKMTEAEDAETIRNAPTPFQAKTLAHTLTVREHWDDIKASIMLKGLRAKFTNPTLRQKLLDTGDATLHEHSPSDLVWGKKGQDMLGRLLMQVREEIHSASPERVTDIT